MWNKVAFLISLSAFLLSAAEDPSFTYNGFRRGDLSVYGVAGVPYDGLLRLTNCTVQNTGQAFYPDSIKFKDSPDGSVFSFSTSFVFAIISDQPAISGHGIAFVIAPTRGLPGGLPSKYLGLFNASSNGNASNHVLAVELDTHHSSEFQDINNNHVGIDINGLRSNVSAPTAYYDERSNSFRNISLNSGKAMHVWVVYDGPKKEMNVSIAPINVEKPSFPLLSLSIDLSPIIKKEFMFIGFSSATGSVGASHYVLGWSFRMNSLEAAEINLSDLPKLPTIGNKRKSLFWIIGMPIISTVFVVTAALCAAYIVKRKKKFAEEFEDWELDYGPQRFKFKELYIATKGFKQKELLGVGGFGRVYKGVLPTSANDIAVKRVSHESKQGLKEFVAEIVSLGQLRHRNLVPLLGYCRRRGELLLVYDYMSKGSLDKYLFGQPRKTLNWRQRFVIIKGVASGLFYLHEGGDKVVIHRDVKASNILLDDEFNGKLSDFGLARLYDHGADPQTTQIAGTLGYLAPEQLRTGKATTSTDVYAFGAFMLEVACGRRPIETITAAEEDAVLVDWVYSCYMRGDILEAKDRKLGTDFVAEEMELVLKLGLFCSQCDPAARPTMHQVLHYLKCDVPLPELSPSTFSGPSRSNTLPFANDKSFKRSADKTFSHPSVAESLLSGGR